MHRLQFFFLSAKYGTYNWSANVRRSFIFSLYIFMSVCEGSVVLQKWLPLHPAASFNKNCYVTIFIIYEATEWAFNIFMKFVRYLIGSLNGSSAGYLTFKSSSIFNNNWRSVIDINDHKRCLIAKLESAGLRWGLLGLEDPVKERIRW